MFGEHGLLLKKEERKKKHRSSAFFSCNVFAPTALAVSCSLAFWTCPLKSSSVAPVEQRGRGVFETVANSGRRHARTEPLNAAVEPGSEGPHLEMIKEVSYRFVCHAP